MCLPLREEDPVILYRAPATPRHAIALLTLIVPAALANDLRPATAFAPGAPVEVDPIPPSGSTSAPLLTFPVWRPR